MSDKSPPLESLSDIELKAKLNSETGRLSWLELQRFFAMGKLMRVHPSIDMLEVAFHVVKNNSQQVAQWLESQHLSYVDDQQAKAWLDEDAKLWCVVVSPWVLVQARSN